MGSVSTQPEPIKLTVNKENNLHAGCLYYIDEQSIITCYNNWYAPLVCAMQDANVGDEEVEALCFLVTPEMVFEVKVADHLTNVATGAPFGVMSGDDDEINTISTNIGSGDDTMGIIVNADSYQSTGKVLVRFHCTKGDREW